MLGVSSLLDAIRYLLNAQDYLVAGKSCKFGSGNAQFLYNEVIPLSRVLKHPQISSVMLQNF